MRARSIKPAIFLNEDLGTEDPMVTLAFIGLWCAADKEGYLEDRPLRLKAEIFPYRENIDFNGYLTVMSRLDLIQRINVGDKSFIHIKKFTLHQKPHHTEKGSWIKDYIENYSINSVGCDLTVNSPLSNGENLPEYRIMNHESGIMNPCLSGEKPPDENRKSKSQKFIQPTIEEISAYCRERNNGVDPVRFHAFYDSKGWMIGKNKMKNWKSAIVTWEKPDTAKKGRLNLDTRNKVYTGTPEDELKQRPWMRGDKAV